LSFTATLSRYELVEIPARVSTGPDMGKAGTLATWDVINSLNNETIVQGSTTPRVAAIAALNGASVPSTALVQYRNSSGSVVYERTLSAAN
jgi:hypothetical protein